MSIPEPSTAPFTLPINIRTLPKKGQHIKYSATEEVCAAIAKDNALILVENFDGKCLISPWERDGVELVGGIRADVIQPCAISFEPLRTTVHEEFRVVLAPEGSKLLKPQINEEGEWIISADGADPPEAFIGDSVDCGALFLEYFILGLDLHARLPGVEFSTVVEESGMDLKEQSPFAVLSSLKKH